ncbi:carbon monoxide dehydrogenase subunit G [Amycolatopsis jiangsuensis]|uniref:Carbon monoxide dehydrogenase subunit G n=1 Tax=Amycolatopsis jiangsuensis TaxID=1181879 RepID=A0A840IVB8_9PSEU|nr:carbon monoxide dehydrogenase subunit G [Amycolatopsis jiangsuensis]
MRLDHEFTVPAPLGEVWQAVIDPERVAPCMPGAALTQVDGDTFAGTVKVKLGPISLLYKGKGEFLEKDEAARKVVIKASGKDSRGAGTAAATVTLTLTEQPGGGTHGAVATDLSITGRPAQFGRGMISEVGGKILDTFATNLAGSLATSPATEGPGGGGAGAGGGAAGAGGAGGVAGAGGTGDTGGAGASGRADGAAASGAADKSAGAAVSGGAAKSAGAGGAGERSGTGVTEAAAGAAGAAAVAGSAASAGAGGASGSGGAAGSAGTGGAGAVGGARGATGTTGAGGAGEGARAAASGGSAATAAKDSSDDSGSAEKPHLHSVPAGGATGEAEPIDLLDYAGQSVAKRLIPVAAGAVVLVVVLAIVRALRRR